MTTTVGGELLPPTDWSHRRVAFVITGLAVGGAEMMLYKLLRHGRLRESARVFALGGEGPMAQMIRGLGVDVTCLRMDGALSIPRGLRELHGHFKSWRPDLVSTWMYHADLIGGLVANRMGVPVIWNIRNGTLDAGATGLGTAAVVRVCAMLSHLVPDRIITCSRRAGEIHAARGYQRSLIEVIPNGFELDRFHPSDESRRVIRTELGISEDSPLIGIVGRDHPQKNFEGFLLAARRILASRGDARFIAVGSGWSQVNSELACRLSDEGLSENVQLLGRRDDVPAIMAALDILVSTSSFGEAFPNVLGEAMASCVTCVVTDVGDSAEIVGDTGAAVPLGDMTGLADAVLRVLSMPLPARAVLRARARERVGRLYDINVVADAYDRLFSEVGRFH